MSIYGPWFYRTVPIYHYITTRIPICTVFCVVAIYILISLLYDVNYIHFILYIYFIFHTSWNGVFFFSSNSLLISRTRSRHLRHQLHISNRNRSSNHSSSTSNRGRRDRHRRSWTNSRHTWQTLYFTHQTQCRTRPTTCTCRGYLTSRSSPTRDRIPWWPPVKCTSRTINHSTQRTGLR